MVLRICGDPFVEIKAQRSSFNVKRGQPKQRQNFMVRIANGMHIRLGQVVRVWDNRVEHIVKTLHNTFLLFTTPVNHEEHMPSRSFVKAFVGTTLGVAPPVKGFGLIPTPCF